jgi:inner membrane protein involved in colicin E2 resistance
MLKRLMAIGFILVCTAAAWFVLAGVIWQRTNDLSGDNSKLRSAVEQNWGTVQNQAAPFTSVDIDKVVTQEVEENGKKIARAVKTTEQVTAAPLKTRAKVNLSLEHRQKGLNWYSTYKVDFEGSYRMRNPMEKEALVNFNVQLPATEASYDNLLIFVNGQSVPFKNSGVYLTVSQMAKANEEFDLRFMYRSQGLDRWAYMFSNDNTVGQVRDFELTMTTNFKDIDFPEKSLSATRKTETGKGWNLEWKYVNLLSGYNVALGMPEHLQPGELVGRISMFAPVSLLFFFFIMFIITVMRNIPLHPMHYFFMATSFFAFHLLMAYLVDHIDIHLAFVISAVVSVFLVVSYLRIVVGTKFAFVEAAVSQLIYLVGFSYAFFFKGATALTVTIGAIITLFVVMQLTARVDWNDFFGKKQLPGNPLGSPQA